MTNKWEHDLQLSIHSFYVQEHETGFRACERILNSSAPEGVKNNAMSNMAFYIKPISEMCDVEYTKIICAPFKENWSLFNPSIINYDNGYLILIRSSNYIINNNGYYVMPEVDNQVIKTQYIQLVTDKDFDKIKERVVKLPDYPRTNYSVDGLEDIRVFKIKDQHYVSGTIRNMYPYDYICRIGLAKYDPVSNEIGSIKVIDLKNNRHEKNWMPVDEYDYVKWIYACSEDNKTKLVNEDLSMEERECNFLGANNFRGGSQLIKIDGRYYSIIHEVSYFGGKRVYYHRMVEWNDNFKITRISKLFSLKENNIIEFSAGMCFGNNSVHITFGYKDNEAYIASLSLDSFYSLF